MFCRLLRYIAPLEEDEDSEKGDGDGEREEVVGEGEEREEDVLDMEFVDNRVVFPSRLDRGSIYDAGGVLVERVERDDDDDDDGDGEEENEENENENVLDEKSGA